MSVTRIAAIVITAACCVGCGEVPEPSDGGDLLGPTRPGLPDPAPMFLPEGLVVADPPPPPIQGGSLLATSNDFVIVGDQDRDAIFVVSLSNGSVSATLELEHGDRPGRMVEGESGRVHVALRGGGAVVTLDPPTGEMLSRVSVCPTPNGLEFHDGMLHVVCETGELYSWRPREASPLLVRNLGRDLRDVVAYGDDLYVTRFRSAEVIHITADGDATERRIGGWAPGFGREPHVAWQMRATPGVGVHVLHQLHRPSDETVNDGGLGYASNGCDGDVVVALTRVDEDTPGAPRMLSGVGPLVVDFAVSEGGLDFAIAATGRAFEPFEAFPDIFVYDMEDERVSAETPCGAARYGHSWPDTYEVVSIGYDRYGALLMQSREPAVLLRKTLAGTTVIELSDVSRKDTGLAYFHADSGSGLACASCHPAGRDDGHVWLFEEEGERRTQSLAGTLAGTAPYHWDGSMADLSELMGTVFMTRMRGASLSNAQRGAFASWLTSIPAPPGQLESDASIAGRAIYVEKGCPDCHGGDALTDNSTRDVGTGQALQVPSLIGIGTRFPYMHDGCAPHLDARFSDTECGGTQHGDPVGGVELFQLIQYLETL